MTKFTSITRREMLRLFAISPAAFILNPRASGAADIVLARDGQPTATIITNASPTKDETLAAQELQTYLRKISGATLSISSAMPSDQSNNQPGNRTATIRLGIYGTPPVREWRGEKPKPDGYALSVRSNALWIVGGDGRGARYGVYEFLETLGVRWFMPGELGEDVLEKRTIKLAAFEQRGTPAFQNVSGLVWAGGAGAADWERHIRAEIGNVSAFFGHNWSNIIAPSVENKSAHPTWFALNKGARIDQLCSTEPDVIRISIEKARQFFDANPDAVTFSISPNDGEDFCECERCQALDHSYGVTDGTLTDRFVHYANQVLAELRKTHPTKQVGILAYVKHTRPPVSVRPDVNFATIICHTPWEFCHVHALAEQACPRNKRFMEYVAGWTKVCRHVGIYDYYGHFHAFTPWPILHDIRRDIPTLHRTGVERFMSETQQHWANQGINFYLAAKLLWNPRIDADALLTEYYERFYGVAAQPMRRYWERWEAAMIDTAKLGDGGYIWQMMFTPELIAECDNYLKEAERRAINDRDKVRRRVAFARTGFRFTEAWTRMQTHARKQQWAQAVAAGDEAIHRIEETAGTEPQAFWIYLAKSQTEATIAEYRKAIPDSPRD